MALKEPHSLWKLLTKSVYKSHTVDQDHLTQVRRKISQLKEVQLLVHQECSNSWIFKQETMHTNTNKCKAKVRHLHNKMSLRVQRLALPTLGCLQTKTLGSSCQVTLTGKINSSNTTSSRTLWCNHRVIRNTQMSCSNNSLQHHRKIKTTPRKVHHLMRLSLLKVASSLWASNIIPIQTWQGTKRHNQINITEWIKKEWYIKTMNDINY
jgi:hypothetical protein